MRKPMCIYFASTFIIILMYDTNYGLHNSNLILRAQCTVLSPNMTSCNAPSDIPALELEVLKCCAPPPVTTPLPLFTPNPTLYPTLKVRRPAHLPNATYGDTLARAYSLMKDLPPEDPRSFAQQANIHCAYCNTVYNQNNSTDLLFQVHGNWLFFPFHRWYLYFHERILAKLLGDDTFSLPFWNYDHPNGSTMPWMYTQYPILMDDYRNPDHMPPAVVAIDYAYNAEARSAEEQLHENAAYVYRSLIRDAESKYRFFGYPFKHGEAPRLLYGTVEEFPHNSMHVWSGSATSVGGKDMGSLYAAARDPVFYPHHAELDRMWVLWKDMEGNEDIDEDEYLDAEFAFYNEDAELVRVKVRDALDTRNLGYVYEEVDVPWMVQGAPVRLSEGVAELNGSDELCEAGVWILAPCSATVQRDMASVAQGPEEENLIVAGLTWTESMPAILDVFLNLPSATANTTSGCEEFVGTFHNAAQFSEGRNSSDFRLHVGGRIRALNLTSESSLVFTFVPKGLSLGCPTAFDFLVMQYSPVAHNIL